MNKRYEVIIYHNPSVIANCYGDKGWWYEELPLSWGEPTDPYHIFDTQEEAVCFYATVKMDRGVYAKELVWFVENKDDIHGEQILYEVNEHLRGIYEQANELVRYKEVFDRAIECAANDNAEQAMKFLLNMDTCLDDEEKVTDENRKNYRWLNGEWRARK